MTHLLYNSAMKPRKQQGWTVKWVSVCRLDGRTEQFLVDRKQSYGAVFFRTREAARKWRDEQYGYIKTREDLQQHGWRLPKVVRAEMTLRKIRH